jgi:hypothetical protein
MREFTVFHIRADTPNGREIGGGGTWTTEDGRVFEAPEFDAVTPGDVVHNWLHLGIVLAENLEGVFSQGNMGVFGDEATQSRIRRGRSHTSTSMGDVIRDDATGEFHIVDRCGFVNIGKWAPTFADIQSPTFGELYPEIQRDLMDGEDD